MQMEPGPKVFSTLWNDGRSENGTRKEGNNEMMGERKRVIVSVEKSRRSRRGGDRERRGGRKG